MKFHTVLLTACFSLLTALTLEAASAQVKIGAILPLSGENSLWGVHPRRGIELALKDLTEKNGTAPFKVVFEDDRCDPKQAVAAFQKLVDQEGVKIILGPSCSSCSLAVAPLAEKRKVLLVTFSEAGSLSKFGDYIFRLYVPNNVQGKILARYGRTEKHFSTAAIISADTAYGHELAEAFSDEFKSAGGTVAAYETYAPDNRDLRSALLKIRGRNPQVLLVAAYPPDGIAIYKAIADMKWDLPLFGASTLNTPDFYDSVGDRANGTVFADLLDRTNADFRARWEKEFSDKFPGMQAGGSIFYDFSMNLAGAIKNGSTPEAVIQYLYQNEAFSGVTGPMAFDKNGDIKWQHTLLLRENGVTSEMH